MSRDAVLRAIIVDKRTLEDRRGEISLADLRHFRLRALTSVRETRRTYPGVNALVTDRWDHHSIHVICRHEGVMIAAARVVPALKWPGGSRWTLPLSEGTHSTIDVASDDSEMSRFIVTPESRGGLAFLALLFGCARIYRSREEETERPFRAPMGQAGRPISIWSQSRLNRLTGAIFADVFLDGPAMLKRRTLEGLGFQSMRVSYPDSNYGLSSEVFRLPERAREQFFDKIYAHRPKRMLADRATRYAPQNSI